MSSDFESPVVQTPDSSPELPSTPVPAKMALVHTPTDSLVSVSLTESDRKSELSIYDLDTTPKDVVHEVLRRASAHISPIEYIISEDVIDSPGAEDRLNEEVAQIEENARERSSSSSRSRSNSTVASLQGFNRQRSDSAASDGSLHVDWETLDKTEQDQEDQSDEQTTLLLARLEQENNAIAVDPKSGIKTRAGSQSRPPSVYQLHRLVKDQGAKSVRFSLLPAAAPMTELDFWAALVRDYPQTAQRLPTITSNKIRSGIPAPLRGVVWVSMSGARERSLEEAYDRLLGESSPYEKMIGKDVGRSFPQHEMFRDPDGEGQIMLGRVLKCYSLYDDKIGYCQGLGFMVGPLLMNMGDKEAFCVLVRLMEDYDLRACFLPDLSGLHLRIYQFNQLLLQHVPKVSAHLKALGVEGEYLSQWFLSFFAVTCPLPLLFRIYDVVFAEGASETIMRVALSIMQRNERKILGYAEFDDVMQLLLSRQLWDVYGLSPTSTDEFVSDFVSFTSTVSRESLNSLEASFRDSQNGIGRQSFLPGVSNAASRFLGRLWTSAPKQQTLSPGHIPTTVASRPASTLLRTPSKQSLSTLASIEATSDFSSGGTISTAPTDASIISRETSVDSSFIRSVKSVESVSASLHRSHASSSKEKEANEQIEDLLMMLSEMQKNQALLQQQLQKIQEDRSEDNVAIRAFIDQVKADITAPTARKPNHRRVASEVGHVPGATPTRPTLSTTTVRLLEGLDNRLSPKHRRKSSNLETKADLRTNLSTVREQLHIEVTRSQELSRQIDAKDQESAALRDELAKARSRIKDSHFDKQRLEKTVMDLKHAQKKTSTLSRSNSRSSSTDEDSFEVRDVRDSKAGGLREFRLGRAGGSRANSHTPTQIFSKRTSSLAYGGENHPMHGSPKHGSTASIPAPPENEALLSELVTAKTSEAIARQELEELKAKFEAMRKMMNGSITPTTSPINELPFLVPTTKINDGGAVQPIKSSHGPSASVSGTLGGFFGWGRR